jgi:hypothetical protein
MPMVVDYIREDHCVPGRVGHLQSVFSGPQHSELESR